MESLQQIARLEELLAENPGKVGEWHGEYIALRKLLIPSEQADRLVRENPALLDSVMERGVGGIAFTENLAAAKCMHLQVATWLGMKKHPAVGWLEENIRPLQCGGADCSKYTV